MIIYMPCVLNTAAKQHGLYGRPPDFRLFGSNTLSLLFRSSIIHVTFLCKVSPTFVFSVHTLYFYSDDAAVKSASGRKAMINMCVFPHC